MDKDCDEKTSSPPPIEIHFHFLLYSCRCVPRFFLITMLLETGGESSTSKKKSTVDLNNWRQNQPQNAIPQEIKITMCIFRNEKTMAQDTVHPNIFV